MPEKVVVRLDVSPNELCAIGNALTIAHNIAHRQTEGARYSLLAFMKSLDCDEITALTKRVAALSRALPDDVQLLDFPEEEDDD